MIKVELEKIEEKDELKVVEKEVFFVGEGGLLYFNWNYFLFCELYVFLFSFVFNLCLMYVI